jgi:DNA polymerase III delta subunit
MKISYKQFFDSPEVPESLIYLILGKPYHLQNDVQSRLESFLKKSGSSIKHLVVDAEFDVDEIRNDFESYSLFEEKKVLVLNIVSNAIPKKLLDYLLNNKASKDLNLIIKLGPQTPAFKRGKFLSMLNSEGCIIEISELMGLNLSNWVKQKFKKNNITYSDELFEKLIEKSEGNTSSISQELYKMSLLNISDISVYFDYLQKEYKFIEYDLIDSVLELNMAKSIKILNYLKSVKSPEVYILFLINSEIKKIYYLLNNLSPQPYIPNHKRALYNTFSRKSNNNNLLDLMELCYVIDRRIKTGAGNFNVWHQLEILVASFILNEPLNNMSKEIG